MSAPSPARSLAVSDKERFILSGSADCSVKIWALGIGMHNTTDTIIYTHICVSEGRKRLGDFPETHAGACVRASQSICFRGSAGLRADHEMSVFLLPPGQCVKSIYTFNAVSSLCFVPEGDGYIITGSGVGGFLILLSFFKSGGGDKKRRCEQNNLVM